MNLINNETNKIEDPLLKEAEALLEEGKHQADELSSTTVMIQIVNIFERLCHDIKSCGVPVASKSDLQSPSSRMS